MADLGLAILSGLLGGLGGAGKVSLEMGERARRAQHQHEQMAFEREKLAETQRQFDEGRLADIVPVLQFLPREDQQRIAAGLESGAVPRRMPTTFVDTLMKSGLAAREKEAARARTGLLATDIERAAAVPETEGSMGPLNLPPQVSDVTRLMRTTGDVAPYAKLLEQQNAQRMERENLDAMLQRAGVNIPGMPGATPEGTSAPSPYVPEFTLGKTPSVRMNIPHGEPNDTAFELFGGPFVSLPQDKMKIVKDRIQERAVQQQASQGAEGVRARSAAERENPLIQSLPAGTHIVDRQTRQEVDSVSTSINQLQQAPGRYVRLDAADMRALKGTQELRPLLEKFAGLAGQLTTTPGANLVQAMQMFAKTQLGIDNPGVAFDALKGVVLRMGGAMQGSRLQLSNQDVQMVVGMLPRPTDSLQTATQRLRIVIDIVKAMEDSLLGLSSGAALQQQMARLEILSRGGGGTQPAAPGTTTIPPQNMGPRAVEQWSRDPATGQLRRRP